MPTRSHANQTKLLEVKTNEAVHSSMILVSCDYTCMTVNNWCCIVTIFLVFMMILSMKLHAQLYWIHCTCTVFKLKCSTMLYLDVFDRKFIKFIHYQKNHSDFLSVKSHVQVFKLKCRIVLYQYVSSTKILHMTPAVKFKSIRELSEWS